MQDIMDGNQGKVFTTTNKLKFTLLSLLFIIYSCNDSPYREEIPFASFPDIYIQLDLPEYNDLSVDGGYVLLNEGVRGIILYRENSTTYHAYERNCSYRPHEAGSTVNVHSSELFMTDPSCQSSFSFTNGYPTGGPAQFPLREYQVSLNRRTLTISDEPIN
ncbi:hypothetical protein GCM10009122_20150 [Fulvivirga kasyanovii]|uniref:Rieske domain-containing protein n=2 Tax=Fulvivirga kasyanovii TaxID=396812 RepID=A0ABW9RPH3_9BACT|nr:hypothetical protein [Fulvivirga kasyanovii]